MLNLKNAAILIAVVLALAACGGGGGGSSEPVDLGGDVPTDPTPDPAPTPDPDPDPAPDPDPDPAPDPDPDAIFQGNMVLGANQVLFNYPAPNEVAVDNDVFQTTGAFGFARGVNAPLESFGLRVFQQEMLSQSNNVRIALELDDTNSDALIQVLVDQATLTISDTGVMSVTVPATAQAHVVVRNAAGESASVSAGGLAAEAVSFTPIPDDPTSLGLILDLDALMAVAIAAAPEAEQALLQSARDVVGTFNLSMTITGITLLSNTGTTLTGKAITVGSNPVVNGAGVSGLLLIGVTPE